MHLATTFLDVATARCERSAALFAFQSRTPTRPLEDGWAPQYSCRKAARRRIASAQRAPAECAASFCWRDHGYRAGTLIVAHVTLSSSTPLNRTRTRAALALQLKASNPTPTALSGASNGARRGLCPFVSAAGQSPHIPAGQAGADVTAGDVRPAHEPYCGEGFSHCGLSSFTALSVSLRASGLQPYSVKHRAAGPGRPQ